MSMCCIFLVLKMSHWWGPAELPTCNIVTLLAADMDLLAEYGSDSSGGSPSASAAPPIAAVAPAIPSWALKSNTKPSESLLTNLPAPTTRPERKKRKLLPLTIQHVSDSDEEVSGLLHIPIPHDLSELEHDASLVLVARAKQETTGEQQRKKFGRVSASTQAARLSCSWSW